MTHPRRYLIRMLIFLAAVIVVAGVLFAGIRDAFMSNAALNGLIVGVLILGIGYIFRTVIVLTSDVAWLENFRNEQPGLSTGPQPRMLAPMAAMLISDQPTHGAGACGTLGVLSGSADYDARATPTATLRVAGGEGVERSATA